LFCFQAEDGIRDGHVTGVQTCALPISRHTKPLLAHAGARGELVSFHAHSSAAALRRILHLLGTGKDVALVTDAGTPAVSDPGARSEERRVGKECRSRLSAEE